MHNVAGVPKANNKLLRNRAVYICASMSLLMTGWYAHSWYHLRSAHTEHRVYATGYRLTRPLLDVELPEGYTINHQPLPLKSKVDVFVSQMTDGQRVSSISVYYRDLADGPWFGINENKEFNPASMMKVPVMIAWLKRAEKDPKVLKQTYVYDGAVDMSAIQVHRPLYTLVKGRSYSVETLLEFMMSYSDNNAASLLYANLAENELDMVLDGMDISNHPDNESNHITVHGYSGFFRILYNASFLNRNMSEKALQLLSREDFPEGIGAGVPKGVVVAAKYGEHLDENRSDGKQLHEFGIVYHPNRAYILGIMTQGNDFTRQSKAIRDISALVYREVSAGITIGEQH